MEKLLEVKGLRVSFSTYAGEVKAVRGMSFDVFEGETLAMVGESGCGKSVTARAILRLFQHSAGRIEPGSVLRWQGQDVLAMNKRELNALRGGEIAMIFQDAMMSLDPTISRPSAPTERSAAWRPSGVRWSFFRLWSCRSRKRRCAAIPTSSPGGCGSG